MTQAITTAKGSTQFTFIIFIFFNWLRETRSQHDGQFPLITSRPCYVTVTFTTLLSASFNNKEQIVLVLNDQGGAK
jgi:hypothetical protein